MLTLDPQSPKSKEKYHLNIFDSYHGILLIGIGILFQSFSIAFAVGGLQSYKKLLFMLFLSSFCLFPGGRSADDNYKAHLLAFCAFYLIIFSGQFREKTLPVINKHSLLIFNIIFLVSLANYYTLYLHEIMSTRVLQVMTAIIFIPSFLVLLNAFSSNEPSSSTKLRFYVWYLIMSISILFTNTACYYYGKADMFAHDSLITYVTLISFGMIWVNIFGEVFTILALAPAGSIDEATEDILINTEKRRSLLVSKYIDENSSVFYTILIIFLILGVILLNHLLLKTDELLLINVALLATQYFKGNRGA